MKIYAPSYYKSFKCIADKCRHNCCINWEIDIDGKTYEKYASLNTELGKSIVSDIKKTENGAHFVLDKNGRCPNLDERGLCRIILELGDGYLSDICRLHPRFFNRVEDRIELGIGLSCEEAVRLVLTDGKPFSLEEIGENEEEVYEATDFDVLSRRDKLISQIENDTDVPFFEKLADIEEKYRIKTDFYTSAEWIDFLSDFLEILDGEWRTVLQRSKKAEQKALPRDYDSYFEAFFKYLVFRHVSTADNEIFFLGTLAFSSFSVKLLKYLAEREENLTKDRLFELVRLYSSEIEYSEDNTENLILEFELNSVIFD